MARNYDLAPTWSCGSSGPSKPSPTTAPRSLSAGRACEPCSLACSCSRTRSSRRTASSMRYGARARPRAPRARSRCTCTPCGRRSGPTASSRARRATAFGRRGRARRRRFEQLVERGADLLETGNPAQAAALLTDALALWRGRALADLAYEPFARQEAERLEELRLVALEQRLEAELELGRDAELVGELEALVARIRCASGSGPCSCSRSTARTARPRRSRPTARLEAR